MTATVKEDGSAVTVGFDDKGSPYVSRCGKEGAGEKFYSSQDIPTDWPGANTALYIAAQIWCDDKQSWIPNYYEAGDAWNAELVAPNLNVIEYDSVELILLHELPNEVTSELSTSIYNLGCAYSPGHRVTLPRWCVDQYETVQRWTDETIGRLRTVQRTHLPNVSKVIEFLDERSTRFGTNEYVLTVNLNTVDKDDREYIKGHRGYLETQLRVLLRGLEYGTPMKREGIVIDDNGKLVKIVNPQFVDTNQFYHGVRNCIRRRTFGNDFVVTFPTCPKPLIDDIDAMWRKQDRTKLEIHQLRVMLYIMRDHYIRAQHQGKLRNMWKFKGQSYPEYVHQATLVAFKQAIDSLDGL